MDLGASVFDLKLRALMCVPLDTRGGEESRDAREVSGKRGVLYVDSKAATREFTQQDLSYFTALSRQIATALRTARLHLDSLERARLEQSLETARIVQSNLMPQIPGDCTGFDLFGWYHAAERTSGDFYDFFKTRGGKLAVVVGDVTGHGPASALITSTAQAFLRSTLRVIDDPCQALTMLNQDLAERMETGLFVTLFLALLEPGGSVQVFNIGHAPPLVWRKSDGSVEAISGHGPALGMIGDFEFTESSTIELADGDILMGFTDGLSEARPLSDPDAMFGEEGLRNVVQELGPTATNATVVGEAAVAAVLAHADGNSEDDLTIVVVRRGGE
jgi:sigma-B regulation protein RsbU (phosphoserine phosphatase)